MKAEAATPKRRHGIWSIVDQGAVSATNFLTIAVGAYLLALPEQGKLVYLYTAYIGVVLFNTAAIFSAAPMIRHELDHPASYQRQLLIVQGWLAPLTALLIPLLFTFAGPSLEWEPSSAELGWAAAFLLLQQLADFNRRADYIFGTVRNGALFSLTILAIRLALLLIVHPDSAEPFFMLLALSSAPGAMAALRRGRQGVAAEGGLSHFAGHFSLARWNIINAPLQWSARHLPVFLVGLLAGAGAAAVLATVRSLSTVANVFLELLETYVPVWMLSKKGDDESGIRRAARKLIVIGAAVWMVASLFIVLFGEALLTVAFGSDYAPYWPVLLILWIGNGLYFVGHVYAIRHRVARRTSVELVGSLGGFVVLLASIPLMMRFGSSGGAWTIMLAQVGIICTQVVYSRRLVNRIGA